VRGSSIAVEILDNVATPRAIKLRFDRLSKTTYDVCVNGQSLGKISSDKLRQGIDVAI